MLGLWTTLYVTVPGALEDKKLKKTFLACKDLLKIRVKEIGKFYFKSLCLLGSCGHVVFSSVLSRVVVEVDGDP